ncbi:hypothetical protein QUF07_08990 [Lentilactobacillus sp. TOM.63]|uniref:hypothetical protein n=1 Tax=Lentilactobacillus dabitei TaxID=2831523 RepID=UPI00201C34EC|nr:hypothetical protein [Lentilactobacillus dabitei]MDM7516849.1 hypothetical protein [Lentilactobacillus sp. TOM.63]
MNMPDKRWIELAITRLSFYRIYTFFANLVIFGVAVAGSTLVFLWVAGANELITILGLWQYMSGSFKKALIGR